jgi:hypothetical protein
MSLGFYMSLNDLVEQLNKGLDPNAVYTARSFRMLLRDDKK